MKCKNCDNEFVGNYCNICGQKITTRFTLVHIWRIIVDDLLEIDRGLIYTLKELWVNPGKTTLNYIEGKTKRYYSPLKYLIFWTAVFLILAPFFRSLKGDVSIESLIINSHTPFSGESLDDFFFIYLQVLTHYTNLFYLGMVPFLSITSYAIYFKKKYNFTELTILYTYLCGQICFLLVVTTPLSLAVGKQGESIFMAFTLVAELVAVLYLLIKMHRQFFRENWFKTIIKSLAILYFGQILYLTSAFVIVNLAKVIL